MKIQSKKNKGLLSKISEISYHKDKKLILKV